MHIAVRVYNFGESLLLFFNVTSCIATHIFHKCSVSCRFDSTRDICDWASGFHTHPILMSHHAIDLQLRHVFMIKQQVKS